MDTGFCGWFELSGKGKIINANHWQVVCGKFFIRNSRGGNDKLIFIDAAGNVTDASALFVDAVMTRPVALVAMPAAYTRIGDAFAAACLVAAVTLVVIFSRRADRPAAPGRLD